MAYCDVTIKSLGMLQWPGKCLVRNVHGVRADFLATGARRGSLERGDPAMRRGAYFLGKALWAKGYRELVDFTSSPAFQAELAGTRVACYGSGPDFKAIGAEALSKGAPLDFHGAIDHAADALFGYHVFVNPSTSEVLCTATAEAVAMGKIVVIPEHPSNQFFRQFQNVRFFSNDQEFAQQLKAALESEPEPLAAVERYTLSWEAAIERLMDAAALPEGSVRQADMTGHKAAYALHWVMGLPAFGDGFRGFSNAIEWKPYDGYRTPPRVLEARSRPLSMSVIDVD